MFNESDSGYRSQSSAFGRAGSLNYLWDDNEGWEGVTGVGPRPVGAGGDWRGAAGASLDCWRGLGVERSLVWVAGA